MLKASACLRLHYSNYMLVCSVCSFG